jgi:hypothetical protein
VACVLAGLTPAVEPFNQPLLLLGAASLAVGIIGFAVLFLTAHRSPRPSNPHPLLLGDPVPPLPASAPASYGLTVDAIVAAKRQSEINAALEALKPSPNMKFRELFFYLDPDVLNAERKAWHKVGREVLDGLSTGQLDCWGRRITSVRRGPLELVDRAYWAGAHLTYWFLKEDGEQNDHARASTILANVEYADLRVNRAQVMRLWPNPLRPAVE